MQKKPGIIPKRFFLALCHPFKLSLMKHFATQLASALLMGAAPWLAATAQTSTIDYRASNGTTTVEKRAATEKYLATSFTFGSYTTTTGNKSTTTSTSDDVFQLTSQYDDQIDGRALVWRQNDINTRLPYGTPDVQVNVSTPYKSQVLLTFSREVTGLTFVIQDIDLSTVSSRASTGGSDFTDEVDFYPLDDDGKAVDMSSSGSVTGHIDDATTCKYIGPSTIDGKKQVALRGTGLNGTISTPDRGGNVTITFENPVKTMLLTYRNLNTNDNSIQRLQTIAFERISWCSQADLTTTIVNSDKGTLVAGKTGKFTVSFGNVGDLATENVSAQVKIAPNLPNVTATNGGVYSPQTGIITYPTTGIAPYGGSLTSVISYTAPAANTLVTATATISTTTSEGLNPSPNTSTATALPVAPLPVVLTAFSAQAVGSDVRLTWTTASEQNNDYFGVERSADGQTFTQVGRVAGHGTTLAASAYAYTDAEVASHATGPVYYRLRQVDLDGTATYSPVRTVSPAAGPVAITLFPNPAMPTDAVTLDLRTLPLGTYQVSLISAVGSTLASYPVQGGQSQAMTLPAALASGPYLVLVQGNGLRLTQQLARR
jgi:hypothetical protein